MLKKGIVECFLFMVIQIFPYYTAGASENNSTNSTGSLIVTIEANKVPMKDVLLDISKQTKYEVAIDNKWAEHSVTGKFTQVTVDEFFKRALHGENISVIYYDSDKRIVVRLFGQKTPVELISVMAGVDNEIKIIHLTQDKEYKISKSDPGYEDMSGMTNAEIWANHSLQNSEYQEERENPNYVDMSGMTNAQKSEIFKQQDIEYQKEKVSPDNVDMSGMTNAKKNEIFKHQDEEYQKEKLDPGYVDMSGMTNAEIWDIQKKQDSEYKKQK